MNFIENQLKTIKRQFTDLISSEKRLKLQKITNVVREVAKHSFFKQNDQDPQNLLPSIMNEVHQLRRSMQSQVKMSMSDYEAFQWKNEKKKIYIVPSSFSELKIIPLKTQNISINEAIENLNFPILSMKIKDLCGIASKLLRDNPFSSENFPIELVESLVQNICERYNIISYHNFSHAFSVFLLLFQCFGKSQKLHKIFEDFEIFITLFSAICHDLNHPGTNSAYQVKKKSQLALLYNNESVLENMHISQLYKMLRQNPHIDIVSQMKCPIRRERMKRLITKLILSTDIQKHQKNLSDFQLLTQKKEQVQFSHQEKDTILENLFHACDIGNSCLEFQNYMNWAILLSNQFHHQTILQRKQGLEVSQFLVFKDMPTFYRSQCSFIQGLVLPIWKKISLLLPQLAELKKQIEDNQKKLKKMVEN